MLRRRKTTKDERVCSICSQAFAKAEHLERHFRSHTKEKPFGCPVCDRKFARHDTLLRHSRSHHTPKTITAATTTYGAPQSQSQSQSPQSQDVGIKAPADSAAGSISPDNAIQVPVGGIHTPTSAHSVFNEASDDQMMGDMQPPGEALQDPCTAIDPSLSFNLSMLSTGGMPSIEPSDQQYGWLPQWGTEMNLDSHWLANLAGDDFNGGGGGGGGGGGVVGSSPLTNLTSEPRQPAHLAQPTQPMVNAFWQQQENSVRQPVAAGLTPVSEPHAKPSNGVQHKWHTFTETYVSGDATPDLSKDRYEVDETCHRTLADRLRQHISVPEPVPPTSFLNLAIQAYFSNFHRIFPIIHAPTFRPHFQNGPLLLSICSVGSLFLGSPRAVSYGISIYERLHKAVLSSWDSHVSTPRKGTSTLGAVQSSLIGQTFGLLLGRPKDLLQVDLFHGTCVAWCRRSRLFEWDGPEVDLSGLEGHELDVAWRKWARNEEQKNILLALLLQDAELSGLLHHDPLLRHAPDQVPRTASKEAFNASSPEAWKVIMLKEASAAAERGNGERGTPQVDLVNLPDVTNDFELLIVLYRVGSVVLDGRTAAPCRSEGARRSQENLLAWHRKYRNTPAFRRQEANLMILWHAVFMSLHMDFDTLERFCGREGPEATERNRAAAEKWATSEEAKLCIIHAVLVQRHCESIPIGTQPPMHFPPCLYRCGIAWFCYTSFADKPTSHSMADLDLTGLEILEINTVRASLEEAGLTDGRPVASPLFKIISLLQRGGQWTIGHSLASTLLALLEDDSAPV